MKFKEFLSEATSINQLKKYIQSGLDTSSYSLDKDAAYALSYWGTGDKHGYNLDTSSVSALKIKNTDLYMIAYSLNGKTVYVTMYEKKGSSLQVTERLNFTAKVFFNTLSDKIHMPNAINGVAYRKFSHFEFDENELFFVMTDGNKQTKVDLYRDDAPARHKANIDKKIAEVKESGIKIPASEIKKLSTILPNLYGAIEFKLDQSVNIALAKKFEKELPWFAEFITNTDFQTRMGRGLAVKSDGITVQAWVDNSSSGVRVKSFKFKKVPTNLNQLYKFIKESGAIEFIQPVVARGKSYADGFAAHVKSTGGHKGNPVYMD